MKRTPLKRKTTMKRTGFKRKAKKVTVTKAKHQAWEQFSRFIRLRGSWIREDGVRVNRCVTCGYVAPVAGVGCIQAGHFIPGRRNAVLYDERGVHPQCHICNLWRKGAWVEYERFMLATYGREIVEELKQASFTVAPMLSHEHQAIAEKFRAKCDELGGWPN